MSALGAARSVVGAAGSLVGAAAWVPVGWLGVLTVAGALPPAPHPTSTQAWRWVVLVPAHDEQDIVAHAVASLLDPAAGAAPAPRVIVIADNCSDATAEVARAAGAEAWERVDADERGKGPALSWAVHRLLTDDSWDALLVLDADGRATAGLFPALEGRLATARIAQAERRVTNGDENMITRLSAVSSAVQTTLHPRGRERLGLAAKLIGTGMAFRRDLVEERPWSGEGLTEDVAYWLSLLEAGEHPVFEGRAIVTDLMPASVDAAERQRRRWQAGRRDLVQQRSREALRNAVADRDPLRIEAVVGELMMPPLAPVGAAVVAGGLLRLLAGRRPTSAAAQAGVLGAHVVVGLAVARVPARTWLALPLAPVAAVWKLRVVLAERRSATPAVWEGTRQGVRP